MFLTSASKFNTEPNGGIFDVSPENDRTSPHVKNVLVGYNWVPHLSVVRQPPEGVAESTRRDAHLRLHSDRDLGLTIGALGSRVLMRENTREP